MTTTKDKAPEVDAAQADTPAAPHAIGDIVKIAVGDDRYRYAIVVGYTDPVEESHTRDHTGQQVHVEAAPHGHPLLLDLPGTPREHQSGTEKV